MEPIDYKKSGVDPDKAGEIISSFAGFLGTRPKDPNLMAGIGPFASCYSLKQLLGDYADPVLVTCCDGVGTKLKLALEWNRLDGLGQDLVAMNVNDLLCTGARPLLFLDYYACGKLREEQLTTLLKSIQHGCELAGCSLAGGETAEMPGLYADGDFDLAGFAVGFADRSRVLGPAKVRTGDGLVAIASSGLHSNGYSLARKIVEREKLAPEASTPFDGKTWRDTLLAPTIIYVSALRELMPKLHAAAHITGGGLYENLPRVLPERTRARVHASSWRIPPLFTWLQEKAGISTKELLSTFNCGVGMILVCEPRESSAIVGQLQAKGLTAWEIGEVEPSPESKPSVLWE